jgi:argininosuccinate synthase
MTLYKGNVIATGRESKFLLYNKELSSMDIEGGYDQKDAAGFIKITGLKFKMTGEKNETLGEKVST